MRRYPAMADLKFLAQEWPAINQRLDEALSLAAEQRDTWLAALVETDSVKETLRRLLHEAARVETGDFLEALPKLTLGPAEITEASPADAASAGLVIGPYRLIRELGVGGMGLVWLAERVDGGLKRQVALKLPRLSWSSGLAERMSRERDILASLDHPNIARLYDAGLDEQGRPYLALEYVEGEAIDVHCKKHALSVPDRLLLILQVARAVAHAHARLVVHRDLKPANILVTAEGQVRLLDFGIAKLMEGELTQETQLTQQGGRALTLDYASPEQIRGEPLGTASDVYSLGVVAYELLAEAKPYQLKRQSAAALEEAIASVDVRLASTAATSPSERRALKGDLDAVLNKALKKNVFERYPSVEAFAQDIERHLANLPVQARPDSLTYRARKFLARHCFETAGVLLAVLGLAGAATVALVQERTATLEARKAEAVKDFLLQMLTGADPGTANGRPPKDVTVQELLDETGRRASSVFADQPDVKAELLLTLGLAYETLDLPDKSIALHLAGLALPDAGDKASGERRVRFMIELAHVLSRAGRVDEATGWLDQADRVFARLHDSQSLIHAEALELRGSNLVRRSQETTSIAQARELLERSAEIYRSRYPDANGRINVLLYLADVARGQGDREGSLRGADEAVATASRLSARSPLQLANAHSSRGAIRTAAGDHSGATDDFAAASDLYRQVLGPQHLMSLRNDSLRGAALLRIGRADLGLQLLQASREAFHRSKPGSSWDAGAATQLGKALLGRGRFEEAEALLVEGRATFAKPTSALVRTEATLALAEVRARQGSYGEAQCLLDEALAVRREREHRELMPRAEVHLKLGLLALHRCRAEEAKSQLGTALTLADRDYKGDFAIRVQARAGLVRLALDVGDRNAAEAASAAGLQAAGAPVLQQDALIRALALDARGRVLCRFGASAQGRVMLDQAISLQAPQVDAADLGLASTRIALGTCLVEAGQAAEAAAALSEAAASIASHRVVEPYIRDELTSARR